MDWVIRKLKSLLKTEKFVGHRHAALKGDAKYAASAQFSKDRIPQLEKAIEILENYKPTMPAATKKKAKPESKSSTQLPLFK